MARARPIEHVLAVCRLKAQGRTDREVSRLTGVPVTTIRAWRNHGLSQNAQRALSDEERCATCGAEPHDFRSLPQEAYAYLLGVYLGDGWLSRNGSSWALRIVLDELYPGIIARCCEAIQELRGGEAPAPYPDHRGKRCVHIHSTWRPWICLFPQHGRGRKHHRKI